MRLGGAHFRTEIDNLEQDCVDPDIGEHYRELKKQLKRDDDSIKGSLEKIIGEITEMNSELKKAKEKLFPLTASAGENRDEGQLKMSAALFSRVSLEHSWIWPS